MAPRGGGRRGGGPMPRDVQVSKKLSWLLRHGAQSEGLTLGAGGYANLAAVLSTPKIRSLRVTFDEVRQIVEENDKQRFSLIPDPDRLPARTGDANGESTTQGTEDGKELAAAATKPPEPVSHDPRDWLIRANQGHSIKMDADDGLLTPITAANVPAAAVHGTTHSAWLRIVASGGLKPMGRNHVHFASGLPAGFKSVVDKRDEGDAEAAPVISGMRNSSTVLMFLDVTKAMQAGLKFGLSDNGVVLTEGNADGLVPLSLFTRVEDRTGLGMLLQDGEIMKEAPSSWAGKGKITG